MKPTLTVLASIVLSLSLQQASRAVVTTLQPDPATSYDSQISDGATAGVNYDEMDFLVVNWSANYRSVGLIKFDLATLPTDATVTSAVVSFFQWGPGNPGMGERYDLFRVTSPWQPSTVTFDTRPTFDANAAASLVLPDNNVNLFREWDITELVSDWIAGDVPNHGLWIEEVPVAGDAVVYFASSEGDNLQDLAFFGLDPSEYRPKLTISWVPEPSTIALAAFGLFGVAAIRRRR